MSRRRTPFFGPRRLRWRGLRLRDAVVLTAPVWVVVVYLLVGGIERYRETRLFDDWYSRQAHIADFVADRFTSLVRLPEALSLRLWLDPERVDPRLVRLDVGRHDWGDWQDTPLGTWGEWVDADRVEGNDFHGVEIRKRGDTSIHWVTEKKSITLKTPRDDLFKGYREVALSAKQVIPQVATNALAFEYDLLAPYTTVSPVFVNERYYGFFRLTELVDESFVRRRGRLPGNIFRGDTSERGEVFKGVPRGLFENPYIWDRVGRNDRPSAPPPDAMHRLVRDVNGTTFGDHLRLMERFDRDELSRLFAYLFAIGDPYHTDNLHNHFWFEDPATGTLHPVVWDVRIRRVQLAAPLPLNALFKEMLRDPFLVEGILRVLHEKIESGRLLGDTAATLEAFEERYAEVLRYDRLREGTIPHVGSSAHTMQQLRGNEEVLGDWIRDVRVAAGSATSPEGYRVLDLRSEGHAPAELVGLDLPGGTPPPRLYADRDRDGRLGAGDREIGLGPTGDAGTFGLALPEPLRPGVDASRWGFEPGPLHYRYFVVPAGGAPVESVEPRLRNALTGDPVSATPWEAGTPIAASDSWHPWRYPEPEGRVLRWAGRVHLDETVRLGPRDRLVIAPGTIIRLAPDVSVLAHGRIEARGRADAPIVWQPADPRWPWGTLALQGAGADDSVFEHVAFEGGGGAIVDRVEYKGMVSVHRAHGVRFVDSHFADNVRSDDTLNAVHSEVEITRCRFDRANADAVDFDYSTGSVVGCRFVGSGNDAVDLMTSRVLIADNEMIDSGDKGVSVGERSQPVLVDNVIRGCAIGVEVKDASEPVLVRNVITGNEAGVEQNRKNWRYGAGGWAKLAGNRIEGNGVDLASDGVSRLTRLAGDGPPPDWLLAAPREEILFEEDFESVADGWTGSGGVVRVRKRGPVLSAAVRGTAGELARAVDWRLSGPDLRHVAVLEVAAQDVGRAALRLEGEGEAVEVPVPVSPMPAPGTAEEYTWVSAELPAGHYRRVVLAAEPGAAGGRLRVRSLRLFDLAEGR